MSAENGVRLSEWERYFLFSETSTPTLKLAHLRTQKVFQVISLKRPAAVSDTERWSPSTVQIKNYPLSPMPSYRRASVSTAKLCLINSSKYEIYNFSLS
jgi:hypothetical protein